MTLTLQELEAKIDQALEAAQSMTATNKALAESCNAQRDLIQRSGQALQAGLDREATLMAELKAAQTREAAYIAAVEAALDHLRHAPFTYENGVTHNGLDEGDVRGGEAHARLVTQLETALKGPDLWTA